MSWTGEGNNIVQSDKWKTTAGKLYPVLKGEVLETNLAAREKAMVDAHALLTTAMTPQSALTKLRDLIDQHETGAAAEFCERAEDATNSSPFVDHMGVYKNLDIVYQAIYKEKMSFRKTAVDKFTNLEADKKTEPPILEEARSHIKEIDAQCAHISLKMIKIKLVVGPPAEGA
eukprot:CAMPEP_0171594230 /NCGR_PEP_ID=MMETSP0990-20121206/576_1 /TAXON_ID=483369 /ORGANISM="non described non described, Strain CCMP2098" /LENGTH=172 /DNA_ID=CAMNT_0012154901 /DNA_START=40 /DNA_END=558 /DNA_ORIENTATION=+